MTEQQHPESLADRIERAQTAPRQAIEPFFHETSSAVLISLAGNPNLQEPDLLRLLARKDISEEVVRKLASHKEAALSYAVKLAIVRHPRTPPSVSLLILKFLHLFDLVRVSHTPAIPGYIRVVAEETILKKVDSLPLGEKIALARQGSATVAAALLITDDREQIQAALDNPYLTEAHVLRVLTREDLLPIVVEKISEHAKWSYRYHVRLALIRNPLTPLQRALAFIPDIATNHLRTICLDRHMSEQLRRYILAYCVGRLNNKPDTLHPTE